MTPSPVEVVQAQLEAYYRREIEPHVTGRNGSPDVYEVLAIYEVAGGLIQRVHFARP